MPKNLNPGSPTRIWQERSHVGSEMVPSAARRYARTFGCYWNLKILLSLATVVPAWWNRLDRYAVGGAAVDTWWRCSSRCSVLGHSLGGSITALGWSSEQRWATKLSRSWGRVCGLHSREDGMWTPIRARSPTASTCIYGYFYWRSPFCCTW